MKKNITRSIAALFCAATVAQAADLYFDANGTDPGFGIDAASTFTVDFTLPTWTTDTNGITGHTPVSTNDVLNFGLEGTSGNLFNFENYGAIPVAGLHSYRTAGSTASINRFQKKGGGFETLKWADGATFEVEQGTPLHWDFGTFGDFEKTGNQWLRFGDGGVKVNGTCTITEGYIVVNNLGTVDKFSSFKLIPNGLRFKDSIDDGGPTTATIGKLIGTGSITREGNGSNIGNLTVQTEGVDLSGDGATNSISFGWGSTVALSGSSSSTFDIAKSGAALDADYVKVDWSKPITYGGDLTVNLLAGSDALAAGDSFQLFQKSAAASFVGSFDNIYLPDLGDPGLFWSTAGLTASGVIEVVVADTNAPSAPTGLTVASNVYTATLDWDDNPEVTVTGYNIYRSETSGSGFVLIGSNTVSEFHDTTTSPDDKTYYYQVTAYNFIDVEGDASDEASTFLAFALSNGDFELPELDSGTTSIDASGHWVQAGSNQQIAHEGWALESGEQGVRLMGWNTTVTNSFYQDKAAVAGTQYTLDAGFKIGGRFRTNGGQVEMSLVWLDGSNAEISRNTINVLDYIAIDGTYVHTNLTATAPGSTAKVRSEIYWTTTTNAASNAGSGDKSTMMDNVSLVKGGAGDLYGAWANRYDLSGSPDADPDYDYEGDGMDNLLEYALGGNPTNSDAAAVLPTQSSDGSWFYHIHNERTDDSSLTFTVKMKGNLAFDPTWETNGVEYVGESGVTNNFKSVTNRTDLGDAEFLRLEVEQN